MVAQRFSNSRSSTLSVLAFAIIVIVLIVSRNTWSPVSTGTFSAESQQNRVDDMSDPVLSALRVSVGHTDTSPVKLTLEVTNTHSSAVTILTWNSPLDPLALQLGLLSFTPEGTNTPIDIPTIQVRRIMPPPDDAYITIEPGQTEERDVVFKGPWATVQELEGKVVVVCKGQWMAVWESKKEDISVESLRDAQEDKDALRGNFESEPVTIEF